MAAVSACFHPAEPCGSAGSSASRSRSRGPAVFPDRRRQDGGLSRSRCLDDRASPHHQWRHARCRRRSAHALYAASSDLGPAGSSQRRHLRAGIDARRAGMARRRQAHSRRLADRDRTLGWCRGVAEPARQDWRRPQRHGRCSRSALSAGRPRGAGADQSLPLVCDAFWARQLRLHSDGPTRRGTWKSAAQIPRCAFTGARSLPILTVDEVIYRRLPAFIIATVDKFAGLPWLAEVGAFFGHVDREDQWGFYGAADPSGSGTRLYGGATLAPPALIIQDELHLISGPLGTVAALYEVALDRLATRTVGEKSVRPKIVASTATVRRAGQQIKALFDRHRTEVFPPPGPSRRNSFFAVTVPPSQKPARLYVGMAAPGKGPKADLPASSDDAARGRREGRLRWRRRRSPISRRCATSTRFANSAARAASSRTRCARSSPPMAPSGCRIAPPDQPFANRRLRDVLELTSRESTDKVAAAKDALGEAVC